MALGLTVLVPFLGRPLVSREQELRVVLTARDMARGGDWLVPHYLGKPRLNKPPLQYWLTALSFRAFGTTQSASVARLPNALLGVGLLGLLAGLGATLMGRRRALVAALAAGTTVLFWRFGRLAETDMALAAFETLTVLCLFLALRRADTPQANLKWWLAAGLAAGTGFMVKGPAALVLPLATVIAYHCVTPRPQRPRVGLAGPLAAMGVCLALIVPWYLHILLGQASQNAARDVTFELGALGTRTKHAGSPLFYLYTLPLMMLPWGVFLPWAVWRIWRIARRHAGVRWALCWLLASLAIMSLTPSKQVHYTTLLLAPAALVLGAALRRPARYLSFATRSGRVVGGVALVTLLGFWLAGAALHERAEPAHIVTTVAADVARRCGPESRIFLAGRRLNSVQYYLDRPVVRVASLAEGLNQAGPGDYVILAADDENAVIPSPLPGTPLLSLRQGKVTMMVFAGTSRPPGTRPLPRSLAPTTPPP